MPHTIWCAAFFALADGLQNLWRMVRQYKVERAGTESRTASADFGSCTDYLFAQKAHSCGCVLFLMCGARTVSRIPGEWCVAPFSRCGSTKWKEQEQEAARHAALPSFRSVKQRSCTDYSNVQKSTQPQLCAFSYLRGLAADVLIHRAVGGAGTVVLTLLIHTKGVPGGGTEHVRIRHVVQAHRDA